MVEKNNGSGTIGIVIGTAVAILLGIVLLGIIADLTADKTTTETYTDSFSIAPARLVLGTLDPAVKIYLSPGNISHPSYGTWRSEQSECDIGLTSFALYNQTRAKMAEGTDYELVVADGASRGYITLYNKISLNTTAGASNTTTVIYSTCPQEYVSTGWARTVLTMVPGFFALALLLGVVFVIFFVLRNEGVEINI